MWFCNDVNNPVQVILDSIQVSVDEGFLTDDEAFLVEQFIANFVRDVKDNDKVKNNIRFYY